MIWWVCYKSFLRGIYDFPGFVANFRLDWMAETIQTKLGENLKLRKFFAQKWVLTLKVTFVELRYALYGVCGLTMYIFEWFQLNICTIGWIKSIKMLLIFLDVRAYIWIIINKICLFKKFLIFFTLADYLLQNEDGFEEIQTFINNHFVCRSGLTYFPDWFYICQWIWCWKFLNWRFYVFMNISMDLIWCESDF